MFLKTSGVLYGGGQNTHGQLGLGDFTRRLEVTEIPLAGFDNRVVTMGWFHTMFLKLDGRVFATGRGSYGQLGLGDSTTRNTPTLISSAGSNNAAVHEGPYNTLFLKTDGSIHGCGYNTYGQLGIDSVSNQLNVVPIPLAGTDNVDVELV